MDEGPTYNGFQDTASGAIEGPVLGIAPSALDGKYMSDQKMKKTKATKAVEVTKKDEKI